jgi:hypothetical protein
MLHKILSSWTPRSSRLRNSGAFVEFPWQNWHGDMVDFLDQTVMMSRWVGVLTENATAVVGQDVRRRWIPAPVSAKAAAPGRLEYCLFSVTWLSSFDHSNDIGVRNAKSLCVGRGRNRWRLILPPSQFWRFWLADDVFSRQFAT